MSQTFLDGQMNLAALTNPGVYTDIILPQPFIAGTPTNIEGLVGVGSWGQLNSLIPISKPQDCAINLGVPKVRNYDIASYVAAATQVGSEVGFYGIRVSDGTDVAASATVSSGITITGKCTGSLGNSIQFSIQNGTLANSWMAVIAFPGLAAEQINNITGPMPASGTATFSGQPSANDTLTIAGSAITFVASGATGLQVNIGSSLAVTLASLLSLLQSSADTGIVKCTYSLSGSALKITANQFGNSGAQAGTAGNALTLAKSATAITLSGATLTGGTGTWQTFWTNLANAINNGNAYAGPSRSIIGTALVTTTPPTLASVTTLTGGTDGDTGVTDATLMGQDIVPRKGMYALRSANVDCFTLCDLSTTADYAAIAAFALSETCYAIHSTPAGDTINNALATRINSGVDSPWFKLILGDWTYFQDTYNGLTRLINPAAFALGMYGNLSPQQSALNKQLGGVVATQRSLLGQTYSDTELSQIETGGIDVVLPPQSSPGGYYFSFGTARNTSSNTAANGDEYTRMTNFLTRASQSKAAGSFVGLTQSTQPNDQTRAQAKALFDGFSAELASPQVGTGINGQGMIDSPWTVVCDLTNNPPNLQAQGYLFLFWQVRYLNIIRFFVVKFMGGGNVVVQSSSTSFAAAAVNTTV